MPGMSTAVAAHDRAVGTVVSVSLLKMVCRRTLCTSTMGVAPLTVIVSSTAPTFMSALIVATNAPLSSMPSRLTVLKPVSVNATEYVPGRRSTIRYWPVPSETAERVFSMRAGLATSTVTPGRTAPDVSFTTPVIDACANARVGNRTRHAKMPNVLTALITLPPDIRGVNANRLLTGVRRMSSSEDLHAARGFSYLDYARLRGPELPAGTHRRTASKSRP